jgi:enoyl-CoA hydratase/carnithine racemase
MPAMSERIRTEVVDGVARVELNRPEKHNGLDQAMFDGIVQAGAALSQRTDVRCVVLSGAGPSFCAGLDFKSIMGSPDAGAALLGRAPDSPANLAQRVGWIWQEVPFPVIAAVHGSAFGGGLQIALGADIRYVAPDARLSLMEIEYGLIPDMAASRTLLAVVRRDVAKELMFTGRMVSGEEAVRLGLATAVADDPVARALEVAGEIARKSPHAVRAAKRLLNAAPDLELGASFALETELQLGLLGSPNQLRAVQARLTGVPATFQDVD